MKAYLYKLKFRGTIVGEAQIRLIENRIEAEDPEHGWYGNLRFLQQISHLNIQENYPILNLTWIEIYADFRSRGHGTEFLKVIEDLACKMDSHYLFCKIDTNDCEEIASKNRNFYHSRDWEIISIRGGEVLDLPHDGFSWMTAYKKHSNYYEIQKNYTLVQDETPDYLGVEWEPTIPEYHDD